MTIKYDALTFEEEITTNNSETLKVYPNPAKSHVNISIYLDKPETVELLLFNINGELVKQNIASNLQSGFNTVHLNLNGISIGLYLLKCHLCDNVYSQKILITN